MRRKFFLKSDGIIIYLGDTYFYILAVGPKQEWRPTFRIGDY